MKEDRGSWYLLTGLVVGFILGVLYAWLVRPAEYVDTTPASLRADFKDLYRALIASAYAANADLVRAQARLELLEDADVFQVLAEQAQRMLAQDSSSSEARALGLLALALGQQAPGAGLVITPTQQDANSTLRPSDLTQPTRITIASATSPEPPTETIILPTGESTPFPSETAGVPTFTLAPLASGSPFLTLTPTLTSGGPFVLLSREKVCDNRLEKPLLQVMALNSRGQPVAGVPVIITWNNGEERFYTGLIPEKSPGYADYTLVPGVSYSVRLGESGEPVFDLEALECQGSSNERYWGAWLLKFIQ